MNNEINITVKTIAFVAYLLLIVPTLIFFLFFLKIYWGILFSGLLITGFYYAAKRYDSTLFISISIKKLLVILLISLLWSFLCGQGGYISQKPDQHWRNAIFHDLINYDWPVVYDNSSALTYYIGYWIVPAAVGKIANLFLNEQGSWYVANFAMLIWTTINISCVILLICGYFKQSKLLPILFISAMLICFSGMDIIGWVGLGLYYGGFCFPWNIEWWVALSNEYYCSCSSNTTLISWCFNQAVPVWLVLGLFLIHRDVSLYAFLGLIVLPFSPFPFLGLFIILSCDGIVLLYNKIHEAGFLRTIQTVLSIPNCMAILSVFPVFYCYYTANQYNSVPQEESFWVIRTSPQMLFYLFFCLIEFGLLAGFLYRYNKNLLFYIVLLSLFFFAATRYIGMDYSIRACLPAYFLLMIYALKYYFIDSKSKKSISFYCVSIILLIGAVTPATEIFQSLYITQLCYRNGYELPADGIKSLEEPPKITENVHTTKNYQNLPFFKYLGREVQIENPKPFKTQNFDLKKYDY